MAKKPEIGNRFVHVMKCYEEAQKDKELDFIGLDAVWKCAKTRLINTFPLVDEPRKSFPRRMLEDEFDDAVMRLKEAYHPEVDLFQGKGAKSVKDPVLGRYYHYMRVWPEMVDKIRRDVKDWER